MPSAVTDATGAGHSSASRFDPSGAAEGAADDVSEGDAEGEGDGSDVGVALDTALDVADGSGLGASLDVASRRSRAESSGDGIALADESEDGVTNALADCIGLALAVAVALVDGDAVTEADAVIDALADALTLADVLGVGATSLSTHRAGMPSTRSVVSLAAAGCAPEIMLNPRAATTAHDSTADGLRRSAPRGRI